MDGQGKPHSVAARLPDDAGIIARRQRPQLGRWKRFVNPCERTLRANGERTGRAVWKAIG